MGTREREHPYHDTCGAVIVTVHRVEDSTTGKKTRRPWRTPKGVPSNDLPIYRFPEVRDADGPVVVVEGEHKADLLWDMGITATCNLGGAGKWKPQHSDQLQGRDVIVWPDNDDPGQQHADAVLRSLKGKAESMRIIEPPAYLGKGDDVVDVYKARGEAEVRRLVAEAKSWEPSRHEQTQFGEPSDSRNRAWTASELLAADFPEPVWKVDRLIPEEGFVVVAGKRKIGKGWFVMQAAEACARGGEFLGRPAGRCRVLIYALEDNPRRIQRRMKKQGMKASSDIVWCFRWPEWEAVAQRIVEENFGLCIIDTLSRATPGVKQNDVATMTRILSEWQEFGLSNGVLVIATDHERKAIVGVDHSMDEIQGSHAKTAVADAIIQLHRDQGKHDTILSADGRDFEEEVELIVKFDRQLACWQAVGSVQEVRQGVARKAVLDAIGTLQKAEELPTTTRLVELTGKSKGYVSGLLADLVSAGEVVKGKKIAKEQPYFLPELDVTKWYESSNDTGA